MKKKILHLIALTIIANLMVGCSSSDLPSAEEITSQVEEAASNIEDNVSEAVDDFGKTLGPFKKDGTISEQLLYDQNDVKITATKLTYNDSYAELELLFENNTDKEMSFCAGSIGCPLNAINGFMWNGSYLYCDVEPNSSVTETERFYYNELLIYGIDEIAEIQTGFSISDEDYEFNCKTEELTIPTSAYNSYDYSKESKNYQDTITSKALKYSYDLDVNYFSDEQIYSSNNISIQSETMITNKDGSRSLFFELHNQSDCNGTFYISNVTINGIVFCDSSWTSEYMTAGKKAILDLKIDTLLQYQEDLMEQVSSVDSIGFHIEVLDSNRNAIAEPTDIVVNLN